MTVRLREQNTALQSETQFAKGALENISHQLRTPLTSVMMILGLMRSSNLTEKERMEYLRDLYELLVRMKWLIPETELPHIFERFYRSSEYTKNGFDIGLAFVKKVISAQNGILKASNHKPHGAVFDIRFFKTPV